MINKVNWYIDDHNGNKYLTSVRTDKGKDALKKYGELWKNVKDLVRSVNNNSDDYNEKYMKIKFNSDNNLPLRKKLELGNIIIVVRSVFHYSNIYYSQIFLDECLYKVAQ